MPHQGAEHGGRLVPERELLGTPCTPKVSGEIRDGGV
jgi:hypothetical protein